MQRSLDENLRFFEEAQVTVGPVLAMDDLLGHPYMAGRQVVTEFDDPDVDAIPAHTPVPRLSRTPGKLNTPAPALGAHTQEIEAELQTAWREQLHERTQAAALAALCAGDQREAAAQRRAQRRRRHPARPGRRHRRQREGAARQAAADAIAWLQGRTPYIVARINGPLRLAVRDLEAVVVPGLQAITVPKVPDASFLRLLDETIGELEAERGLPVGAASA